MSFTEQVKILAKEVRKPARINFPRRSVHTARVNQFWAITPLFGDLPGASVHSGGVKDETHCWDWNACY